MTPGKIRSLFPTHWKALTTWVTAGSVLVVIAAVLAISLAGQWYTQRSLAATSDAILLESENALIAEVAAANEAVARGLGKELEQQLNGIQRILFTLSLSQEIRQDDEGAAEIYLQTVVYREPALLSLSLVDVTGRERVRVNRDRLVDQKELSRQVSSVPYTTAMSGQSYMSHVAINPESGAPFLTLAEPVERYPGETTGVLLAEFDLAAIWDLVALTELGTDSPGYVYVVDGHAGLPTTQHDKLLVLQRRVVW